MNNIEKVIKYFSTGHNCSQSIFCAYSSLFGLDYTMAFKIASAFGGGMGRLGNTCGAVTGALMTLGLYARNEDPEDKENKEKTYELARLFINKFKSLNGSTFCRELIGYDISTPQGLDEAMKNHVIENICVNLVKNSALILNDIINK
jgi:C_GCAxxG_C_C family probable redox protein